MKKHLAVSRRIGILALLLASFGAGMLTMNLVKQEGILTVVARIVQLIPGVMQIESSSAIPAATELRPLQTFWEVRDKVKRTFVYPVDDDAKLTYGAIRGMLASLNDPWTRFYTPEQYREFQTETEGHFDGIGAVLEARQIGSTDEQEVVINALIPEGPASKADVRSQDVIVSVDGVPTKGMALDAVVNRIRGKRGTAVKLGLRREGSDDPIEVEITRAEILVPVVEHKMLADKVGYVWLRSFNRQSETKLREALLDLKSQGMKSLVLDLSINGGGLLDMAVSVGSMFIEQGPIVYVQERGAEAQPLNATGHPVVPRDIPMAVLVDHGSASASEIVAGALQDTGRALVVGQNTFGKSKVQTVAELNDRSALVLSTAVYLTPKKRDISLEYEAGKRGVKPDRVFAEPEPGTKIRYEDWHQQQIEQAVAALKAPAAAEHAQGAAPR